MELKVIDESEMAAATAAAIRAALQECFPADREHYGQTRDWHGSGPAWSVIILDGRQVIAHAGVVDRTIQVAGRPLRVFGPQGVCVVPAHRGKRLVDQVMSAVVEQAGRRGFQKGLLFCGPARERTYARTGWRAMPGANITRVDATGCELPLPTGHLAMYHPLAGGHFPPGAIHLRGNDW